LKVANDGTVEALHQALDVEGKGGIGHVTHFLLAAGGFARG
jgi:hypothetical protein